MITRIPISSFDRDLTQGEQEIVNRKLIKDRINYLQQHTASLTRDRAIEIAIMEQLSLNVLTVEEVCLAGWFFREIASRFNLGLKPTTNTVTKIGDIYYCG